MENHISSPSYLSQPTTPATPSRFSPISRGLLGDEEITRCPSYFFMLYESLLSLTALIYACCACSLSVNLLKWPPVIQIWLGMARKMCSSCPSAVTWVLNSKTCLLSMLSLSLTLSHSFLIFLFSFCPSASICSFSVRDTWVAFEIGRDVYWPCAVTMVVSLFLCQNEAVQGH